MSIQQGTVTSFKVELFNGQHAFGTPPVRASATPDVFKLALYTSSASLGPTTTVYTTTGEVPATGTYSAGGGILTVSVLPTSSLTTAYFSFATLSFTGVITARGALIYNSSQGNRAFAVLDFGANKTSASLFTITFPTADVTSALVRVT